MLLSATNVRAIALRATTAGSITIHLGL